MNSTSRQAHVAVWILGDQLMARHPALEAAEQAVGKVRCRVVMIESEQRLSRLPYQRKKLVLLLSAMRHYAAELEAQGYTVDYIQADAVAPALAEHVARHGIDRLFTMAAADYGGRRFQYARLSQLLAIPVEVVPNTQMISGRFSPFGEVDPFRKRVEGETANAPNTEKAPKQMIMETFYRQMRRHFDVLIEPGGKPTGGAWNFDKENRKPLPKGGIDAPLPREFAPDPITQEVMAWVAGRENGVGTVDGFGLAVTRAQAEEAFDDFVRHRLADFGPLEDAMSRLHPYLFHSVLSPYLNLGLLEPQRLVARVEEAYRAGHVPIQSAEGFIRQVLGWREYIYCQYWRLMPHLTTANGWAHTRDLPGFFWDADTDMACLGHVVERVIELGYSHHIERLMVICNFCLLAGIEPAQVNDWFLAFYTDAYEWVVTPNVIGMGLHADEGKTATKPYIASANYIRKMSDYCTGCRYDPRKRTGEDACPFNFLYWNFLLTHEAKLRANPRLGPAVLGLRHLDPAARTAVRDDAARFLARLDGQG